ncbi:hypothetical protein D7Y13_05650 [Corallococcus praedator]|uniref:Uncharacterized protein n=1 Tax=Corallococcus praedator TaxID=2316724 RepID=A0ABX9QNM8_9BACT|nr:MULTISPECIES: hypothetical protein [Corallococcus]RKH11110.1 hypothetical protein D7X74_26110 [Corallococcus sp. CA047B]RKH33669.1 hypothetical protein D7X75_11330 [Corallococcus sp. CA031C]RKI14677.1 hypothetical protein D7Y13_05650 [Corallococcus praedator]
MAGKKLQEGYGGTSEQRQRHLENDNFSERAPRSPEELEEVRSEPEQDGHRVVTLNPLESEPPDENR